MVLTCYYLPAEPELWRPCVRLSVRGHVWHLLRPSTQLAEVIKKKSAASIFGDILARKNAQQMSKPSSRFTSRSHCFPRLIFTLWPELLPGVPFPWEGNFCELFQTGPNHRLISTCWMSTLMGPWQYGPLLGVSRQAFTNRELRGMVQPD